MTENNHTAKALREHLAFLRIEDGFAEEIVRKTGKFRKYKRYEIVEEAALARGAKLINDYTPLLQSFRQFDKEKCKEFLRVAASLWFCCAELLGSGKDYSSERTTTRMPWASGFGKGRAHATDGGAWDQALAYVIVTVSTRLTNGIDEYARQFCSNDKSQYEVGSFIRRHVLIESLLVCARSCEYPEAPFFERLAVRIVLRLFDPKTYKNSPEDDMLYVDRLCGFGRFFEADFPSEYLQNLLVYVREQRLQSAAHEEERQWREKSDNW